MLIKHKVIFWLKRYLPSEIVGTIAALISASAANLYSNNGVFIAYIGTIGESVGFYSTVFIQQFISLTRIRKLQNKSMNYLDLLKVFYGIILEFGIAGFIDSMFIRPFLLYIFPIILHNFSLGIIVGKLLGDICFYLIAMLSYKLKVSNYNNIKLSK